MLNTLRLQLKAHFKSCITDIRKFGMKGKRIKQKRSVEIPILKSYLTRQIKVTCF